MAFYTKRPITIEAHNFGYTTYEAQLWLANWCGGRLRGKMQSFETRVIEIDTLEGMHTASFGDWIIKGIKGEFYPCKPDIFVATYEPAPEVVEMSSSLGGDNPHV